MGKNMGKSLENSVFIAIFANDSTRNLHSKNRNRKKITYIQQLMKKNIYKGNVLIRRLVILADFIILNCLLLGLINIEFLHVPEYLDLKTKITFFIANVALAIGEYNYSTIIHIRRIGFQQVLKRTLFLVLCTAVCFMIFLKFFSHGGAIFTFGIYFGITFYIALVISRIIELKFLKYNRARGRNIRTVVFVGSDPAVREMYITMTEDPSAGYIVKGYYANDDIAGAPQELKKLGTMEDRPS